MSDTAIVHARVRAGEVRTDRTRAGIAALFDRPFADLPYRAAIVHRAHHAADDVQ